MGRDIPVTEEILTLSKLDNHPRYQRKTRPGSLSRMMRKGLNPLAALVLVVSRRTNGSNILIDGNNRKDFLESKGEMEWPCLVAHGLKEREEADVWEDFNHNRTNARPDELLNAQLVAKNTDAENLRRIVHDCGFRFSFEEGELGIVIDSIASITIAKNLGFLERILDALHAAWPNNKEAVTGKMIHSMIIFFRSLPDLKSLDFNRLVEALRTFTPKMLLLEGSSEARLSSRRCSAVIAEQVAKVYNAGRRGPTRIRKLWRQGAHGGL